MREIEDKRRAEQEEKLRRLEEAEKKRQTMMAAHKEAQAGKGMPTGGKAESGVL